MYYHRPMDSITHAHIAELGSNSRSQRPRPFYYIKRIQRYNNKQTNNQNLMPICHHLPAKPAGGGGGPILPPSGVKYRPEYSGVNSWIRHCILFHGRLCLSMQEKELHQYCLTGDMVDFIHEQKQKSGTLHHRSRNP